MAAGAKGAQRNQRSGASTDTTDRTTSSSRPAAFGSSSCVSAPGSPPASPLRCSPGCVHPQRLHRPYSRPDQNRRCSHRPCPAEPRRVTCRLSTGKPRQRHADRHSPLPDALSGQLGTGLLSPLVRLVRLRADPQRHGGCRRSGTPEQDAENPHQTLFSLGLIRVLLMVARVGIGPTTQGFSVPCSTN